MARVVGVRARITGQVQGLGFRPWVFRLAQRFGVCGQVANTGRGVVVVAFGPAAGRFITHLRQHPPPLARYSSFRVSAVRAQPPADFVIASSSRGQAGGVEVLPDLATCRDCRRELADPADRRFGYPFTNCTRCGPRYTIIKGLPYDRSRTTMRRFRMCRDCAAEYQNPASRRFHAQPNACPVCGPHLALLDPAGRRARPGDELGRAARALLAGKTVAIKSLGGFQLACDATSAAAVRRLRQRKHRPTKPLAVMVARPETAARFCRLTAAANRLLAAPAAPIVLLPKLARPRLRLAAAIAPANRSVGVMVAYTPLHLSLFQALARRGAPDAVLVMTSANRRDDPITATAAEVQSELSGVADLVLDHDRPIANRADDSVLSAEAGPVFIRRARGFAPAPVPLAPAFHVKHPVLAVGADGKNALCLAAGDRAYLSPHVGGIATARAARFWRETLELYRRWTGMRPKLVACDLHPDYLTTRLAEELAGELQAPLIRVQHHHAHIRSVMAEHGLAGPVLGLAFDGTGYGTDGTIWGCEFIAVGRSGWRRVASLGPLRLAGAGSEVADPAFVAAAYLQQAGQDEMLRRHRLRPVPPGGVTTTSLGRLFDAVAGITGACRRAGFDGEAPMALEACADQGERGDYFGRRLVERVAGRTLIRPEPIIAAVSRETLASVPAAVVAARFQNTVVRAAVVVAGMLCKDNNLRDCCLSGGSFLNLRLRRGIAAGLRRSGLRVWLNRQVPINDGGVALGQVAAVGSEKSEDRRCRA